MLTPLLITSVRNNHGREGRDSGPVEVYIKARDLDGNHHRLTVRNTQPRFWTTTPIKHLKGMAGVESVKEATHEDVMGNSLNEVRVDYPWRRNVIARQRPYGHMSDASWSEVARMVHGWKAVIEVDSEHLSKPHITPTHIHPSEVEPTDFSLRTIIFDIETQDDVWHDPKDATGKVVSIAIYDTRTERYEVATTAKASARLVKKMMSSQDTLHRLVEHNKPIEPLNPKKVKVVLLTAGDTCDPEFEEEEAEAALMWWFKRRLEHYDPDILCGHNAKYYDVPYVTNRCNRKRREYDRWVAAGNRRSLRQPFPRMNLRQYQPFDSMIAYQEQISGQAVAAGSGSLAWMATEELGYGKVPRMSIMEMYASDPNLLCVYNIWDVVLVARVLERLSLIPFYLYKAAFHFSEIGFSHSNMMLIESMMGHILYDEGKVMPDVEVTKARIQGQSIESGGFVGTPESGVFEKAFELDNAMEYPAAIITMNSDPTTKIHNPDDYPDGFPFPTTVSPNGNIYRRDREGIMPRILRGLAKDRDDIRATMNEVGSSDPSYHIMNLQQRVIKENMNSFYGVLGSGSTGKTAKRPYRLADPSIASDITKIGQEHEHWNKDFILKTTLHINDDGVHIEPFDDCHELTFTVLYQDTDSCKVYIKNLVEIERVFRPLTEDDLLSIANTLSAMLNESFHDFCMTHLSVPRNEYFRIKLDALYRRYFQWGRKKRYAYIDFNDKMGFRGVEMRRSNVPPVVRTVQEALFNAVLLGEGRKGVHDALRRTIAVITDPEQTADMAFGRPHGLKSQNESTQQWKASQWSNNNLDLNFRLGDKPVLYFVSAVRGRRPPASKCIALPYGESPSDFGVTVDRALSISKYFEGSASMAGILEALNTTWNDAMQGVVRADFGGFFT